ncbi:phage tail protein [Brevibacillus sp. GCM10020057]|uniref:phage tail protein n=1 Tax=Brevibacillus sp. GCM10020057 TaxID=3317327 RepID=UPI003638D132
MSQPYIGEIRMFAGNFAPVGWKFCNGELLAISEYDVLFSLIGTTYGGDGQTTFALPDLRGRIPIGQGNKPGGSTYPMGEKGGQETVTLTVNQIPAHSHTLLANSTAGADTPVQNLWSTQPQTAYSTNFSSLAAMSPAAIAPAGGSQPHENMMPSLVVNFIISLYGVYPSQN